MKSRITFISIGFNFVLLGAIYFATRKPEEKFAVKDGMVEIPDRPGLGLTINQDFVKRYAVPLD